MRRPLPEFSRALARALALPLALLVAALSPVAARAEPLAVVATFSILGDLARQIGGERVVVHTLVGPDADAHVYQPTPTDARQIGRARLVIANGLGYEGWIERLVKAAGYRGEIVQASRGITALRGAAGTTNGQHGPGEATDPHAWQDLDNARHYIANLATALIAADPAGKAVYEANARRLSGEAAALHEDIRRRLGSLPEARRAVVTSHDAFGYFARAYGIRFRSPVGVSTDAAASAAGVARLIRQIKREKIPAVFLENISDPRMLERIRAETGARIGGALYSDALSRPTGPAGSYLDMMRHNARALEDALRP